jgi:hypothetical protein
MRAVFLSLSLALPLACVADDPAPADLGTPLTASALDAERGGDDTRVDNIIHVTGDVTNNSATDVVTGANNIQDGSFNDARGIFSVVQNTGANVLIQSATIVNVEFADP